MALRIVAIAVVSYFTAGLATAALSGNTFAAFLSGTMTNVGVGASMGGGFAGGFVAGFLGSGGDIRTALLSGAGGALTAGIGAKFGADLTLKANPMQFIAKAVLHGSVQGGLSTALGGDFASGALGGFAGSVFEPLAGLVQEASNSATLATVCAAIVGGTVAVIGGGKFANGALSAAFVDLFNRRGHRDSSDESSLNSRLRILKAGVDYRYSFSQSTGDFTIYAADGTIDFIQFGGLGFAWSGYGPYINDPAFEMLVDRGVTPRGLWDIGPADKFREMEFSYRLTPIPGMNAVYMGGRNPRSFVIHGPTRDRSLLMQSSQGCPILYPAVRQMIDPSLGRLYVY